AALPAPSPFSAEPLPDLDLLSCHQRELVEVRVQLLELRDRNADLLRDRPQRVAGLHDVDGLGQVVARRRLPPARLAGRRRAEVTRLLRLIRTRPPTPAAAVRARD